MPDEVNVKESHTSYTDRIIANIKSLELINEDNIALIESESDTIILLEKISFNQVCVQQIIKSIQEKLPYLNGKNSVLL